MREYDHLTRDQLISRIRELETLPGADRSPGSGRPLDFPEFTEWHTREFEKSPWAMRIFEHATFRFLAVNDAAVKLYGYSREEFLTMTARDTRHPDEHKDFLTTLEEPSGYFRHRGPRRHIKKSGEVIVVEVVTQDILFHGRKARLSMNIDVTERNRMVELLRKREQEFESLAENLPDLVARFDQEYRFVYINSAVEKLLGARRQDMLGKTQRELGMPEAFVEMFRLSLDQSVREEKSHSLEFSIATSTGERLFEAYHVPEKDVTGRIATVLCVARDITERKHAEEELRRQKNLFAAVIDNLPVGVFIRDAKTQRYMLRNRFSENSFGYRVDTSAGKTAHDLFPKEQADLTAVTDEQALKSRQMVEVPEMKMLGKAGDTRIQHVRKVPVFDQNGEPWMVVGIADDITDRKRAENALRESNEFLRSVIESSLDCITVLDLKGHLLSMNAGGQKLLEIDDLAPLLNLSWPEFWRDEDRAAARAAMETAHSGGMGRFEGCFPTRKGAPRWWDVVISPILDAEGRPAKLLAVSRDITRRRKIDDELRESEERFRQLAENIRQVFWINTQAGDRILYVSPAYEEIWGRSRGSLYRNPRNWIESILPDDLPAVQAAQEKMPGGQSTDVEYRIVRPDGTLRWIRDRSYPMTRSDGTMLTCGIAEDITGLKLAEQERLTHAIHQRDALVREVHHRIKNSLQGVVGLLRSKIRSKPAAAQDFRVAIAQIQSIALVYGLQSKPSGGAISLAEILDAICSSVGDLAGGFIDRQFRRESGGSTFLAENEAVPIAVVLNELIFNGLKHSQATRGERRVQVALGRQAHVAVVTITNRGVLPAEFDFKSGRGVGVGLDLVRTLLSPKGSKLAFHPGRGTVEVTLELRPPLIVVQKISAVA